MRPLLSYFAAQEIPAALITFVSLLVFLQTGSDAALSVCYSALLALAWVMKGWMGKLVMRSGHFRITLLLCEVLLAVEFLLLSVVLSPSSSLYSWMRADSGNGIAIFAVLFLLALTTAWHERVATLYYDTHLHSRLRTFYNAPRVAVSQVLIVVTYGLFIIFVGTLEVYTRSICLSWAIGSKIAASTMLLFVLWHCLVRPSQGAKRYNVTQSATPVGSDFGVAALQKPLPTLILGLLLLPQALMFYTRVLYLLAPVSDGGLGCSLQVLGFAHGVVGALAFSLGLVISRRVQGARHSALLVVLSPVVYLFMNIVPPTALWQLCLCTFVAQLSFGYGLHHALRQLGLSAAFGLRRPAVALVMLPAMAVSGWLLQRLGFSMFFLVDTLTVVVAIPAWLLLQRR